MRAIALLLLAVSLAGCHVFRPARPGYIVTSSPFYFLGTRHPGFCIAVDPADTKGVWWWEPGKSGCASRSTGPTVFPADRASVIKTSDRVAVQFEVQLQVSDPLRVTLTLDDEGMRREPSGERVAVERRRELDMPESCCPVPSHARTPPPPGS